MAGDLKLSIVDHFSDPAGALEMLEALDEVVPFETERSHVKVSNDGCGNLISNLKCLLIERLRLP